AKLVITAHTVVQGQPRAETEAILSEESPVMAATVVVLADVVQFRADWDAQQEVAEVIAGVSAGECEGAVVVCAEKAQRARRADRAHVRPKLEDVASIDPRQLSLNSMVRDWLMPVSRSTLRLVRLLKSTSVT